MNFQLREGLQFPQQYILSHRSDADHASTMESWVATHTQTGDRVLVRVPAVPCDEAQWAHLADRVKNLRGLLHQNIRLITKAGTENGLQYLIEPHIADGRPIDLGDVNIWPLLRQILDALEHAHHLGIAHGTLHPGNLIVDSAGTVHVSGFGMPETLCETGERSCLSPQVRAGREPGIEDDMYSLGCLIFRILTGKNWQPGVEPDLPLDAHLDQQLRAMLSESSFERPTNLPELRESLTRHFEGGSSAIETVSFSRQSPSAMSVDPVGSGQVIGKRQEKAIPMQWVLAAGLALIVFAVLLFTLLPTQTPDYPAPITAITVQPKESKPSAPAVPVVTPLDRARLEMYQKQGEELTREILRQQLDLEDMGIKLWAPLEYAEIEAQLEAADSVYRDGQFDLALEQYKQVKVQLLEWVRQVPQVLATHIESGNAALDSGDAEAALTAWTIATTIDRENKDFHAKLARAESLDEVQALVQQAEIFERNGDLENAGKTFRKAKDLDPKWPPAQAGFNRIQQAITTRDFQTAMSQGFLAISNKDYEAARAGFLKARKIRPNSKEPDDGFLQIEQAERNDVILAHQKAANRYLSEENWQAAIEEYEAALAIADSLEFAKTGLATAKARLQLQMRLQDFLSNPASLQSDEVLAEASATLRQASRVEPKSTQLLQHIDLLARLISTARIEIPVTIRSDGNTDVTVRKHAALGKITRQVVHLIPGRYTIVGVRQGYRDVREDIIILAGEPVPELTITSTEKIR